ncbi:YVTN repeat-like/Quino protein amine dehydrogenase [Ramaria rubella]|nr:YVTN repeat-like/Quino protein amine dehydrogenase [Ramaria rubella]
MPNATLAYDFTEIYNQTYNHVCFSPGTQFILTAVQDRLIVRRSDTFQIARTWLLENGPSDSSAIIASARQPSKSKKPVDSEGWITHIGWSADTEHILAACAKGGVVHIFSMRDEAWHARIDAGAEGLVKAEWAPDGRNVLCFSEWGASLFSYLMELRVTVWSLVTGSATYVQYPKYADKGYAFRKDGRYLIVAERHKSKDALGIYDTAESYKLARHVPLPSTSLSSLALSPTGDHLAFWEGPLEYKLYIMTLAGCLLTTFTPERDPALGIRTVAWHPSGSFIAVGGHDDKIHILSALSWTCVKTLELHTRIPAGTRVWRESADWLEQTHGYAFQSYDRVQTATSIPLVRTNPEKPDPKSGAIQLEWNVDGSFLMVRFENAPTALHIYDFPKPPEPFNPQLRSVLLHNHTILRVQWNPVCAGSLLLCCGTGAVYTWTSEWEHAEHTCPEIAECIGVPTEKFKVRNAKWSPDGKGLILLDQSAFCCAFEATEEIETMK